MNAADTFFSVASLAGAGAIFVGTMLRARGTRAQASRWAVFRVAYPVHESGRSRPLTEQERERVMRALEELSTGSGTRTAA